MNALLLDPRPATRTPLGSEEWRVLQEKADRFAAARRQGTIKNWNKSHLPATGDSLRRLVLLEFIKIDMDFTWRNQGRALIETYETLFPEIIPSPADLIVEEYRIRHRHGDKPTLDEYRERFPDRFEQIEQLVAEPSHALSSTYRSGGLATQMETSSRGVNRMLPPGYRAIAPIGRGNFGEVWKAEAPGGIAVAVKIVTGSLKDDTAQKELRALDLVKNFGHPALVQILAFYPKRDRLVIIMELCDCTLRDLMNLSKAQGMGIPVEELIGYFHGVAAGLDWLHARNVWHRDVKPENILLREGFAKIADYGLAREQPIPNKSVTFAGTPAYLAPEAWTGKPDQRSDQYSLAFTFAELRLGRRPLCGADFLQVMTNAIDGTPNLEGLSPNEQDVLRQALAKNPSDRFESCLEFVRALERTVTTHRVHHLAPKALPEAASSKETEEGSFLVNWAVPILAVAGFLALAVLLSRL